MNLLESLDGEPVEAVRDRCGVPLLQVVDVTRSTNDDLRAAAEAGAPAWTCLVAEFQQEGRGRHGQPWQAGPGQSLLFSTLVRFDGAAPSLSAAPVRVGLRVARALERVAAARAVVKWPNDVYIDDRKVAGILCEGAVKAAAGYLIVGIGVNVSQQHWPDDLPNAISLLQATGRIISRADLLSAIIAGLRQDPELHYPLSRAELDELRARDFLHNRAIAVDDTAVGVADGITADGELRVIGFDSRRRLVRTGSVRLAEP